jgi:hypothetical protein
MEVPVSWPSKVVDAYAPPITSSTTLVITPTTKAITGLSPSLIFAGDCKRLVGASQEVVFITGVNFGAQTKVFFGLYLNAIKVELSVQGLECGLVNRSLVQCATLSRLACTSFEKHWLAGGGHVHLLIAATDGNHTATQMEGIFPAQLS